MRLRSVTLLLAACLLAVCVANVPSVSAFGGTDASAAKPGKPPKPPAMLVLSASVAPSSWLAGAQVTVTDRNGTSVQGVTNSLGHLSVPLDSMKNDRWPLHVVTEAGSVAGRRFGGHLQAYAWNPGVTHLNLSSTAAARIAGEGRGKSSPSQKNWSSASERVRTALGIPASASAAVLEGGNRHLDGGRLGASVDALGGWGTNAYDRLVEVVVRAAEKKTSGSTPSLDLAHARGTIVVGGPSLMSSTPGKPSAAAPCGAITPETPTSEGKSAGFWVTVGTGIAVGMVTALTGKLHGTIHGIGEVLSQSAEIGHVAGGLFEFGERTGESPDSAQLTAITEQLTCISSQIDAVQDSVDLLSQNTTLQGILRDSGAQECANKVTNAFKNSVTSYTSAVKNAIPQAITLDPASQPSQLSNWFVVPTGRGSNMQTYANVTGPGILPVYFGGNDSVDPSRPARAGVFQVSSQLLEGGDTVNLSDTQYPILNTSTLRGMRVIQVDSSGSTVTVSKIGVNADGSPATVTHAENSFGTTTLTLSAPFTATSSGTVYLAFATPNYIVSTQAVQNGTRVNLKAPLTAVPQTVSVATSLYINNQLLPAQSTAGTSETVWRRSTARCSARPNLPTPRRVSPHS